MNHKNLKYIILLLVMATSLLSVAQQHLISEVTINQKNVYVGEPVQVKVGVYSSTWFTKGVRPGNIKVTGAFTVFFRSVSQSKNVDGKDYAGVEMIFNVFPYDDDDLIFPSLEFEVETPDPGGYKGVNRMVVTKEKSIKVKPIPAGYNKDEWLVAANVTVDDFWTGNLKNVKVGDVLERTISRNVSGTISELIPPIVWDTLAGVSMYPARSDVNTEKTRTSISASRTERMRYLFEKEGSITIPELVITWWNPERSKLYKRTLRSFTIDVQPNPELGMIESLRDSLAVTLPSGDQISEQDSEDTVFGLSKKELLVLVLAIGIIIYLIFRFMKWLFITKNIVSVLEKRREAYRNSETYYFRQFKSSIGKNDNSIILQSIYNWIDVLNLKEPTIEYFAQLYGNDQLIVEVEKIRELSEKGESIHKIINLKNWTGARKNYLKVINNPNPKNTPFWINP